MIARRFDRYFFDPVAAVRPWLLARLLLAILVVDCVTLLPRAERYGLDGFNVAHFEVIDALAPSASATLYGALLGLTAAAALVALLRPTRALLVVVAAAQTGTWSISVLDNYQHHYLTSLVLGLLALFPAVDRGTAARERIVAWPFRLLAANVGLVYAWAAIAKLDPVWLGGEMVWLLVRDPLFWWSGGASAAELLRGWAEALGVTPQMLLVGVTWSVIALELLLAVAYFASAHVSRGRLGWAVAAVALAFHATNEVFLMLRIGWFSYYMAAIALVCFLPEAALRRVPRALALLACASAASLAPSLAGAKDMIVQVQPSPAVGTVATQPAVNMAVVPIEYADGKKFPLQSFISPVSSSDGLGYILVSEEDQGDGAWANRCLVYGYTFFGCDPQSLFLGLTLPLLSDDQSGQIEISIDSERATSFVLGQDFPKDDDRRIRITYGLADMDSPAFGGPIVVSQLKGNGNPLQPGFVDITGTPQEWPYQVVLTNGGDGALRLELRVQLTSEIVVTNARFGLGIQHALIGALFLLFHQLPNQAAAISDAPTTWQTVVLGEYESIPMEVVTYNIGQFPHWWVSTLGLPPTYDTAPVPNPIPIPLPVPGPSYLLPLRDTGVGSLQDFADVFHQREVVCVNELWAQGERQELVEEINSRRAQLNLGPMAVVGLPPGDNPDGDGKSIYLTAIFPLQVCRWLPYMPGLMKCYDTKVDQYTGLLLLSARPMLERGVFEFGEQDSGQCYGDFGFLWSDDFGGEFDCAQDKGMLWGRILTVESDPGTNSAGGPEVFSDLSQFIDVFCSHTDAGSSPQDTEAAMADFTQLKTWIDAVRMRDRPAILAGDMNISARNCAPAPPPTGDLCGNYSGMLPDTPPNPRMIPRLGLDQLTPFDQINTTFSDVYDIPDLSMGVREGTSLGDQECKNQGALTDPAVPVYDYVFLLPPPTSETNFPNFTIKKDPTASVDRMFVSPDKCLSDHAMVQANFDLVQTYEPGKWNPTRTHVIQHRLAAVWDLEEGPGNDSDWQTDAHWLFTGPSPGGFVGCNNAHSSETTCDGDNSLTRISLEPEICVPWESCSLSSASGFAGAFVDLDDEEGIGVTEWDTSDHDVGGSFQRSLHFLFDHLLGSWVETSDAPGWSPLGTPSLYDDTDPPPDAKTFTMGPCPVDGDGFVGTEETDYFARTCHELRAVEQ